MSKMSRANGNTDEKIIATYNRLRSAQRTAKEIGGSDATVYRVLAKHGIKPDGTEVYRKAAARFTAEQGQRLREEYDAGSLVGELLRRHGGTFYSIKKAIRKAGGTIRANPAPTLKDGELEMIERLYKAGMSQLNISLKIGRSQGFVSQQMRKNGLLPQVAKGNGYIDQNGYRKVLVASDDPLACMRAGGGYVLEHRLNLARALGRPLLPTETVHHINGDRLDNRVKNLQLRQGRHGKHVAMCCLDCGSHRIGPAPIGS